MLVVSVVVLFAPSTGGTPTFPGLDKLVHLLLFGAIAASVRWRFGGAAAGLVAVATYAVASELVQAGLLAERGGDVLDVVADLAGAGLGWLSAGIALSRRART